MYKFGTVKELNAVNMTISEKVYQEVLSIATMLDKRFDAERDVECDEGGFIFIALDNSDLTYFKKNYVELNSELLEAVFTIVIIMCEYVIISPLKLMKIHLFHSLCLIVCNH